MDLILSYGIQTYVRRRMSFSRAQRAHGGAMTIRKIKKQDEKTYIHQFLFLATFSRFATFSLLFAGTFASSSEKL